MFYKNFQSVLPIILSRKFNKEIILVLMFKNIIFSLNILKYHVNFQYKMLSCISCIDLLQNKYRFCISYELLSLVYNSRLRIKTFLNETLTIVSVISVYQNANWFEREAWDLFGVYFEKHSDLRRLLTDYGFEGHPMRKDFPLFGYTELRFNETKKRIVSEQIQLAQQFRFFTFETPW